MGLVGSAAYSNGTFNLNASGTDIWDFVDQFHYVYQPLIGDGTIVARVASIQNSDPWAKSGVMIRETLATASTHASLFLTPANGLAFQRRLSTGAASTSTTGAAVAPAYWVRLTRSGNVFTASASPDGATWTVVGVDTVFLLVA